MIGDSLPITDNAQVFAVLPAFVRQSDSAIVRDAIVALLTNIFVEYQTVAEYAASQSDILYATSIYLDGLGQDRGFQRQLGEDDEPYRSRILGVPNLVTPMAIMAAVAQIIAPYTDKTAKYFESALDQLFLSDGSAPWHSFIGDSPSYLDRLYADDTIVNGTFIPGRDAGGAWMFSDTVGRYFVIRIPLLPGADGDHAYLLTGAGSFLADGSNTAGGEAAGTNATFLFADRQTALDVYAAIINTVSRIKGQSIRWSLIVDPSLS